MIKSNKTMFQGLDKKCEKVQTKLLTQARHNAKDLRKKHRETEGNVRPKIIKTLQANCAKREQCLHKKRVQKSNIIKMVKAQGGPCQSKNDIKQLLMKFKTIGVKTSTYLGN